MISFRNPKGVQNRPTPDWYVDILSFVGWSDLPPSGGAGGFSFTFSLFNNDTAGRLLYVYAVAGGWDGTAAILCDYFKGAFGTQVNVGKSVNPLNPDPPGVLYEQSTHYPLGGFTPDVTTPLTIISSVFTAANIATDWPLFIIPKGYSARFNNNEFCEEASIGIWYVPLAGN